VVFFVQARAATAGSHLLPGPQCVLLGFSFFHFDYFFVALHDSSTGLPAPHFLYLWFEVCFFPQFELSLFVLRFPLQYPCSGCEDALAVPLIFSGFKCPAIALLPFSLHSPDLWFSLIAFIFMFEIPPGGASEFLSSWLEFVSFFPGHLFFILFSHSRSLCVVSALFRPL